VTKESINKLQESIKNQRNLQNMEVIGENHPKTLKKHRKRLLGNSPSGLPRNKWERKVFIEKMRVFGC